MITLYNIVVLFQRNKSITIRKSNWLFLCLRNRGLWIVDALDFQSPSREEVSDAGEITMKRHWGTDELDLRRRACRRDELGRQTPAKRFSWGFERCGWPQPRERAAIQPALPLTTVPRTVGRFPPEARKQSPNPWCPGLLASGRNGTPAVYQ